MITKIDLKKFAEAMCLIEDLADREKVISYIIPVFASSNPRFDEEMFRGYIREKVREAEGR